MGLLLTHPDGTLITVFGSPTGACSPLCGGLLNTTSFEFLFHGKVLEVGVGKERLSPNSVTVDINSKTNPDFVVDAKNLPFKNKEFDLAIAHEVLCTMSREDQLDVIREMVRVSRAIYIRSW